ncbi:hypothetical protein J3D55_002402 [Chryseobacterium ginsenosidimutans]|uniref:relaxase/mobilization nuclease domain-containing protein n=1 Tax=Chryseobacterium ginsenosidimutans TaxID=687846 RepID=UPI00216A0980|nr:relaxase/mobilization nuclease domain-containing protein [Chryseobacterium ginsenosidimutans]MCS3869486.1 hypothetical protein [Chryseobacterium ginsenosidimutans]
MIAKIGRSSNLIGTLSYNNSKMEQDKGEILMTNKIIETADRKYSVTQLARSFEPYLLANRKTEKHTLHISLNPDPKDKVSDEQYQEMAQIYMDQMGYGDQPFVVFKHTDIDRSHIHIVSVAVDENGKKISDTYEKIRSMKICRELEKKFKLISATEKQGQQNHKIFQPVDYIHGNIKSQIGSVIKRLPSYYQFQSLGEYNALLSLFNITVEKVEGELHGQLKRGLLYFPLDSQGKKAGNPFKASLFGKNAGINAIENHFTGYIHKNNDPLLKQHLRTSITEALQSSKDEQVFKKKLKKEGIDTIVRKNENGRIYGITFIDQQSKTVWNGSRLGKECSANIFNDCWNNNIKKEIKEPFAQQQKKSRADDGDSITKGSEVLFDLVNRSNKYENGLIESIGGFLPLVSGEDHEEENFADRMKKKRRQIKK